MFCSRCSRVAGFPVDGTVLDAQTEIGTVNKRIAGQMRLDMKSSPRKL